MSLKSLVKRVSGIISGIESQVDVSGEISRESLLKIENAVSSFRASDENKESGGDKDKGIRDACLDLIRNTCSVLDVTGKSFSTQSDAFRLQIRTPEPTPRKL